MRLHVCLLVALCGCDAPSDRPGARGVDAAFVGTGARACEDPSRRAEAPFDPPIEDGLPSASRSWVWGGGAAAGDLDGDGDLDVVTTTEGGLMSWEGGPDGLGAPEPWLTGLPLHLATLATTADYDGDGDLDLYVGTYNGTPAPDGWPRIGPAAADDSLGTTDDLLAPHRFLGGAHLLRNDGVDRETGELRFTDVTEEAGGVDACGPHHRTGRYGCFRAMTASFGDVDRDGDLDLYVGSYGELADVDGMVPSELPPGDPDFLYLNQGDGTFVDGSEEVLPPEVMDGYTFAGGFFDLDGDGWLDLLVVNDMGERQPNAVLWNREGRLEWAEDDASGLQGAMTGMGLGIDDLNGDGRLDLAVPQWGLTSLLVSEPDLGVWVDVAASAGITTDLPAEVGWATVLADLDNDADTDLVSSFGHLEMANDRWSNDLIQPNAAFRNDTDRDGRLRFSGVADAWGLADGAASRGILAADLDGDGWLDVLRRNVAGPTTLQLARCGAEGWLVVELDQPGTPNRDAIGAVVRVEAGDRAWTRRVVAGGTSFQVGEPPEVHFGLGDLDRVDRVEVVWPDGERSTSGAIDTRQRLVVTRK